MKKKLAKRFGAVTLATVMGTAPVTAMAATDITGHWAEAEMTAWEKAGWLNGFPDGTMRPNETVTRAQFVSMINRVLGFTEAGNASFSDVPSDSWFSEAVRIAVAAGYASGMSDTTFEPNSTVTRAQAATFVSRAIGATNSGSISQYTDTAEIPTWARDAVGSMSTAGYLQGMPDGSFDPNAGLTRAQAVSFLERVRLDHGVSDMPSTEDAALIVDKAETVISDQTIDGNVIVASTVREGNVTFRNVHITGDLLIQGGGANSIYLEDCTIDGRVIMDKADVRLVLSGTTVVNEIQVLKVCHIDSKDFTGRVKKISFVNDLSSSSTVEIDVDVDEIIISANVSIVINGEVGKVHVTTGGAGSSVTVSPGAQVDEFIADEKVTIKGEGTIGRLEVNTDGVVVDTRLDIENLDVADGVTAPSGTSTDGSTSSGSGSTSGGSSDTPAWTPDSSGSGSTTTTTYAISLKATVGEGDEATNYAGETLRANESVSIAVEAGANIPELKESSNEDNNGNTYYVRWKITGDTDKVGTIEPSDALSGADCEIDAPLVITAKNEDAEITVVAQYVKYVGGIKDVNPVPLADSDSITIKTQSTAVDSYDKLVSTVAYLNTLADDGTDLDPTKTNTVVATLQEEGKATGDNSYDAYIIPIEDNISIGTLTTDQLDEIEYTGKLPLIFVPVEGDNVKIDALKISSTAPIGINSNVVGLTAANMQGYVYAETDEQSGLVNAVTENVTAVAAIQKAFDAAGNDIVVGTFETEEDYNSQYTETDSTLSVGTIILNAPEQAFANNGKVDKLIIDGASEIIANAEITETVVNAGAGAGSGNEGSYGSESFGVGTSNTADMSDAVWLRGVEVPTFASSHTSEGASIAPITSSTVPYYKTVTTEENILISADVDTLVVDDKGIVVDVATMGGYLIDGYVAGEVYGGSSNSLTFVTIGRVETADSFAIVGLGAVKYISITSTENYSDDNELTVQIETMGNYQAVYGAGTNITEIKVVDVVVGYVAGATDDADGEIYAFGGYKVVDTDKVPTKLDVLEFLASPTLTIGEQTFNNGTKSIDIPWELDLTDLEFLIENANSDGTTVYYSINLTPDKTGETGKTVTESFLTQAIDIRTNAPSDATQYKNGLYAMTAKSATGYENNENVPASISVYIKKDGATGDSPTEVSPTEVSSTVTANLNFLAPVTTDNGGFDDSVIAANSVLSTADKYNESDIALSSVVAPITVPETGFATIQAAIGTASNRFKEGNTESDTAVYVYFDNDAFDAFKTSHAAAVNGEVNGTLSTQIKIDNAATDLATKYTTMISSSKIDVADLIDAYAVYTDVIADNKLGATEFTTTSVAAYKAAYAAITGISSQANVTAAVTALEAAFGLLVDAGAYTDVENLSTFDFTTNFTEADYTANSWAEFTATIATLQAKNITTLTSEQISQLLADYKTAVNKLCLNLSVEAKQLAPTGFNSSATELAEQLLNTEILADTLNQEYIYTGVEAEVDSSDENVFTAEILACESGDGSLVKLYTQKITVDGPNSGLGPDTVQNTTGSVTGGNNKLFVRSINSQATYDYGTGDGNYEYWANLELANLKFGSDVTEATGFDGVLVEGYSAETDSFDGLVDLALMDSGSNAEKIYVPVDRYDIGGGKSFDENEGANGAVVVEEVDSEVVKVLSALDGAKAYYYVMIPGKEGVTIMSTSDGASRNITTTTPDTYIKFEIEFEDGANWASYTDESFYDGIAQYDTSEGLSSGTYETVSVAGSKFTDDGTEMTDDSKVTFSGGIFDSGYPSQGLNEFYSSTNAETAFSWGFTSTSLSAEFIRSLPSAISTLQSGLEDGPVGPVYGDDDFFANTGTEVTPEYVGEPTTDETSSENIDVDFGTMSMSMDFELKK